MRSSRFSSDVPIDNIRQDELSKQAEQQNGYQWTALSVTTVGALLASIQGSALLNMKINWASNPTHQKIFFTILNSKLAEIKDLHSQIKDLHSQIKDLLLLKYFGKKYKIL